MHILGGLIMNPYTLYSCPLPSPSIIALPWCFRIYVFYSSLSQHPIPQFLDLSNTVIFYPFYLGMGNRLLILSPSSEVLKLYYHCLPTVLSFCHSAQWDLWALTALFHPHPLLVTLRPDFFFTNSGSHSQTRPQRPPIPDVDQHSRPVSCSCSWPAVHSRGESAKAPLYKRRLGLLSFGYCFCKSTFVKHQYILFLTKTRKITFVSNSFYIYF